MSEEATCQERIGAEMESRLSDLRKLWTAFCEGDEDRYAADLGTFDEYSLSFDYVQGDENGSGYFRYQLSYGGPSDEFRFFCDADCHCYRVEYWFLDWGDGAHRILTGEDRDMLLEIFDMFDRCGAIETELKKATQ